jgi:beta-N-acetylhexosaminidase
VTPRRVPRAVVFGCLGPALGEDERRFFAEADPLGFVLFARNVDTPDQVTGLVGALREAVGRADAPVLIDQEGGRVARLGPPHWRDAPPARRFGELARLDRFVAAEAAALNSRLIAHELTGLGIDVDCLPVLDVPVPGAHDVIGNRAYAEDPDTVAMLGRAACGGLLAGGVLPVIKHIPGHGRARADSHLELAVVEAPLEVLERSDFAPFRALSEMPLAMTAHVVYGAVDGDRPATISPLVIERVIRGAIGFDGLLITDDIAMEALSGTPALRARAAIAAGCDVVLHCTGVLDEMAAVAEAVGPLSEAAQARLAHARALRRAPQPFDVAAARQHVDQLVQSLEA